MQDDQWPLEISSQACLPHMLSGYRVSFRIHPSWVAYRIGILKPMFHISSEAFESKTHCSLTQLIHLPKIFPLRLWLRLVLNCLFFPAAKPMTHLSNAVGAPTHFSCVSVFKIRQFFSWRDFSSWGWCNGQDVEYNDMLSESRPLTFCHRPNDSEQVAHAEADSVSYPRL